MIIDCDTCVVRDVACGDCVISVLLANPRLEQPPPFDDSCDSESEFDSVALVRPIEFDPDEQRAVVALAAFGLVPPLRLVDSHPQDDGGSQGPNARNRGEAGRQNIA
jgi:hypothetical protein